MDPLVGRSSWLCMCSSYLGLSIQAPSPTMEGEAVKGGSAETDDIGVAERNLVCKCLSVHWRPPGDYLVCSCASLDGSLSLDSRLYLGVLDGRHRKQLTKNSASHSFLSAQTDTLQQASSCMLFPAAMGRPVLRPASNATSRATACTSWSLFKIGRT